MQFKELQLNNFGKFHNKTIDLKDGLNLIYGENEAGKSTVHFFIRGMLFGIEKLRGRVSKEDAYTKYQPWDNPSAYQGSLILETGGKCYRLFRNFDKNNKSFTITDMETGREVNLNSEELTKFYGGLTEGGYRNTVSIEQLKARTDQELAEEVRNYITNLSMTKSNEVDISKALSFLQERKKELEEEQLDKKLSCLEKEIAEGLEKEAKADRISARLKAMEETEKNLLEKRVLEDKSLLPEGFTSIKEYEEYLEQYPVIREKYYSLLELEKQLIQMKERQNEIQKTMQCSGPSSADIRKELDTLTALSNRLTLTKDKKAEYLKEQDIIAEQKKRYQIGCIIPVLFSIVCMLLSFGKNFVITGFGCALLLIAAIFYCYCHNKIKIRQQEFVQKEKDLDKEVHDLIIKRDYILQSYQTTEDEGVRKKYEEAIRRESAAENLKKQMQEYEVQISRLENRIFHSAPEIENYFNRLENGLPENRLDDVKIQVSERFIKSQKQILSEKKEEAAKEYENCLLEKEKLRWELSALEGYEEKLMQDQDLHKDLLQKKQENETEIAAVKLAVETINSLSIDIHDSFGKELNHLVSALINNMTKGNYSDVKIDEKLNIKVGHKDIYVQLDKLSAGTMEQLFLALRIAVSDLLYKDAAMPILLDDCFAYYDEKRTAAALEYLIRERKGQILLFTCHKREKEILDSFGASYHYVNLS